MSTKGIQDPAIRSFLEGPRFATIATIDADGAPFSAVVWYVLEGDTIIVNSAEGRRWPTNLRRDPRVSFTVEDGYDYVQILGNAHLDDNQDRAQAQMALIAARYLHDPEELAKSVAGFRTQHRVAIHITPRAVFAGGSAAIKRIKAQE